MWVDFFYNLHSFCGDSELLVIIAKENVLQLAKIKRKSFDFSQEKCYPHIIGAKHSLSLAFL